MKYGSLKRNDLSVIVVVWENSQRSTKVACVARVAGKTNKNTFKSRFVALKCVLPEADSKWGSGELPLTSQHSTVEATSFRCAVSGWATCYKCYMKSAAQAEHSKLRIIFLKKPQTSTFSVLVKLECCKCKVDEARRSLQIIGYRSHRVPVLK